MKSAWSADGDGFRFDAGPLSGMLVRSGDGRSLAVAVGGWNIGGLGALSWRMESDGATGSVHPTPDVAYIQQPYVVAPFSLETPPEFRLTGFFRAVDEGVDVDFRLATVWPVAQVTLDLHAEWPAGAYRPLPELTAPANRPYPCPGVAAGVMNLPGTSAAFFTDVGEHGEFVPAATGATLRLFNQSLEKGVILVGRFALRPSTDSDSMNRDLALWLDHPSASL
jgi:hypothetical protein